MESGSLTEAQAVYGMSAFMLMAVIMGMWYLDKRMMILINNSSRRHIANEELKKLRRKQHGRNEMKYCPMIAIFICCLILIYTLSNDVTNPFQWILDLEGRHEALIEFLDLTEKLIPRHWEVIQK